MWCLHVFAGGYLTDLVAACDVMSIVAVLSRKTGDPLPGASRIAVPILLMTTLRSLMETHLSSFGQDRTEENGVATFHLSQSGMYAIYGSRWMCFNGEPVSYSETV